MSRVEHDMFFRQYGTCVICLQMATGPLCVDDPQKNGTTRPLICDAGIAGDFPYDDDPDVARLVAAFRADDG